MTGTYAPKSAWGDVTRGASWSGVESTTARASDAQAEVVTEAVNNGPYAPATLNNQPLEPDGTVRLAAFSPVTYTDVTVTSHLFGHVYGSPGKTTPNHTETKKYAKAKASR